LPAPDDRLDELRAAKSDGAPSVYFDFGRDPADTITTRFASSNAGMLD